MDHNEVRQYIGWNVFAAGDDLQSKNIPYRFFDKGTICCIEQTGRVNLVFDNKLLVVDAFLE